MNGKRFDIMLRAFFKDYPSEEEIQFSPTLMDLAYFDNELLFLPREPEEEELRSVMPGDSQEGHPLKFDPVDYMGTPYVELKRRFEVTSSSDFEERLKLARALAYKEHAFKDGDFSLSSSVWIPVYKNLKAALRRKKLLSGGF